MSATPLRWIAAPLLVGMFALGSCQRIEEETGLNEEGTAGATAGATLGGFTGAAAAGSAAWGAGGMILGALLGGYLGQQAGESPADDGGGGGQVSGPLKLGPIEICFQNACVDREDRREHAHATYDAFLSEPVGSETSWENPATGSHGTTTITEQYQGPDGNTCKRFSQRMVLEHEPGVQVVDGAACRQADGTWAVVDVTPHPDEAAGAG